MTTGRRWAMACSMTALLGCERERPASVQPGASAGSSATELRAPVDAAITVADATPASAAPVARAPLPPEPQCTGGSGPVRISVCREPEAGDATPGFPVPYDKCMAAFNGHAFSAQLTDEERRRGHGSSCCYLDRCQISYGY